MVVGIVYQGALFTPDESSTAAERRVVALARGLAKGGATVLTLSKFSGSSPDGIESAAFGEIGAGRRVVHANIRAVRMLKKCDVLYFYNCSALMLPSAIIARLLGIPLFYEVSDLHVERVRPSLRDFSWLIAERLYARIASSVVAISSFLATMYRRLGAKRVLVIPASYDPNIFGSGRIWSGPRPLELKIGCAGSNWEHEGIADLFDAAHRVSRTSNYSPILVIAGRHLDGPRRDSISELGNRFPNVGLSYVGMLESTDELVDLLCECSMVVVPQKSAFSAAGFPTKLAEYAALGLPIVCTNVGDVELYLENGKSCLMVPPDDPDKLAAAIISLAADSGLARKLSAGVMRVAASAFSSTEQTNQLLEYFRSSVADGGKLR